MAADPDGPPAPCALCKARPAAYDCLRCGRPICDPCAAAAPDWRFECLECASPLGWYQFVPPEGDPLG